MSIRKQLLNDQEVPSFLWPIPPLPLPAKQHLFHIAVATLTNNQSINEATEFISHAPVGWLGVAELCWGLFFRLWSWLDLALAMYWPLAGSTYVHPGACSGSSYSVTVLLMVAASAQGS